MTSFENFYKNIAYFYERFRNYQIFMKIKNLSIDSSLKILEILSSFEYKKTQINILLVIEFPIILHINSLKSSSNLFK